jgi:hypothetical protein
MERGGRRKCGTAWCRVDSTSCRESTTHEKRCLIWKSLDSLGRLLKNAGERAISRREGALRGVCSREGEAGGRRRRRREGHASPAAWHREELSNSWWEGGRKTVAHLYRIPCAVLTPVAEEAWLRLCQDGKEEDRCRKRGESWQRRQWFRRRPRNMVD